MRLSIFILILICCFKAYSQQSTVSSDNFIIRNAAGSVSKPINMDSVTAYDARNLGNQAIIGSLTDTILVTNAGVIKKLVGDAKINGVIVGRGAGNITSNTVVGNQAGQSNTTGYQNSFLGLQAGYSNTTGGGNSFIGNSAGYSNLTGNNNLFLGYNAGNTNISGSSNTYLGVQSTGVTNEAYRSNMLVLGSKTNGTYIFGDSTGNVGIGTTSPQNKLTVNGYLQVGNDTITGGPVSQILFKTGVYPFAGLTYTKSDGTGYFHNATYLRNTTTGFGVIGNYILLNANLPSTRINNELQIESDTARADGVYPAMASYKAHSLSFNANSYVGNNAYNFGIGTTTPSYKLDVSADSRFNGVVVGRGAGNVASNTVVGLQAGYSNTSGSSNAFLGFQAGFSNSTGYQNAFLGYTAGYNNLTGNGNSFIGYAAGYSNTASNNSFIGVQAGYNNTTGNSNCFIGSLSGISNLIGSNNSFIGYAAGYYNTSGYSNSFIGVQAGYNNTTGNNNSFIGYQAGISNLTGNGNSFIGYAAGYSNTASNNSFIGVQAGYNNTTGNNNSFIGYQAGISNLTGSNNSFIGYAAGYSNTASNNSFIGVQAGYNNTTGNGNSFIGYQAGISNLTGNGNSFIGYAAGISNLSGYNNSFLGVIAGYYNSTGYSNCFLGYAAGYSNTSGYNNSFLGYQSGQSNTTGSNNLYLGNNAGGINISGSSNTYLGVTSTGVTNGSSRSNMLAIGTYSNGTYIFGDSTGAIGIGTTSPAYKLDVNGTGRFAGNVGIGTAPTSNALEVAGNLNIANGILSISGGQYLTYGTGTINGYIGTGTLVGAGATSDFAIRATNNIAFGIGSSQKMTLASNGYLGLGTVTPAYVLDVSATANPLRLQGLQTGALTDDILSSSSGVVRKLSISQIANPIKAYVMARNSNTSFTSGSSTQIAYTTVVKDSTSSFSANTFTAPRSGIYSVAGVFALVNGGGITTVIDVTAGGTCEFGTSNQILGSSSNYNNTLGACNFSANVFMNAGETIFIKATQTTGITQTAAAATRTYLTIKEL